MSSAIPARVDQFVAMRFLRPSFIAAMVVAAHQLVDAQTLPHVGVRAGSGIPVKGMQAEIQAVGKISQWDVPPKFISGAAPIYPPSRLRQREPGYALIEFTVDQTGHTRDFRTVERTYLYFANHAILAVQNWRFQPAVKNGRPVPCRIRVPFRYRIPGVPDATPSPSTARGH
jgi:TonB family protein